MVQFELLWFRFRFHGKIRLIFSRNSMGLTGPNVSTKMPLKTTVGWIRITISFSWKTSPVNSNLFFPMPPVVMSKANVYKRKICRRKIVNNFTSRNKSITFSLRKISFYCIQLKGLEFILNIESSSIDHPTCDLISVGCVCVGKVLVALVPSEYFFTKIVSCIFLTHLFLPRYISSLIKVVYQLLPCMRRFDANSIRKVKEVINNFLPKFKQSRGKFRLFLIQI